MPAASYRVFFQIVEVPLSFQVALTIDDYFLAACSTDIVHRNASCHHHSYHSTLRVMFAEAWLT